MPNNKITLQTKHISIIISIVILGCKSCINYLYEDHLLFSCPELFIYSSYELISKYYDISLQNLLIS